MKLEFTDDSLLFLNTSIPDVFFTEYLPLANGDFVKIYLYTFFLAKHNKEIKTLDLAKKLSMPIDTIKQAFTFWDEQGLIIKKQGGYIFNNPQLIELNKLYRPKMAISVEEAIDNNKKNTYRNKAINAINVTFFQGVMSPSWIADIETWFKKYEFDEQVMLTLFRYCFDKSKLNKNYVQAVAQGWFNEGVKTYSDLESYFHKYEKADKIKKSIVKKLGFSRKLTEYEESYVEKWVMDFGYDFDIIEIALKKTTSKVNPNFDYLDKLISDWNNRGFKSQTEVQNFLKSLKQKQDNIKQLEKKAGYNNYEQRNYDNLDALYANFKASANT